MLQFSPQSSLILAHRTVRPGARCRRFGLYGQLAEIPNVANGWSIPPPANHDEIADYIAEVQTTKSLPYRPMVGLIQIR
jgi:hypothetical protein